MKEGQKNERARRPASYKNRLNAARGFWQMNSGEIVNNGKNN